MSKRDDVDRTFALGLLSARLNGGGSRDSLLLLAALGGGDRYMWRRVATGAFTICVELVRHLSETTGQDVDNLLEELAQPTKPT
jgi:hypothetical protein